MKEYIYTNLSVCFKKDILLLSLSILLSLFSAILLFILISVLKVHKFAKEFF